MKKLIIVSMMLITSIAQADTIGAHLGSAHDKPGFNNENPGLYYVHNSGATIGHFKNSEYTQSTYAGYTMTRGNFNVSFVAISGYKRSDIIPAVIPSYALPLTDKVKLRTSLLFNPYSDGASALHWSLEYEYERTN